MHDERPSPESSPASGGGGAAPAAEGASPLPLPSTPPPQRPLQKATRPTERSSRFAKDNRKSLSLPEVILWQRLRRGQTGFRFRRQHPIGPFIADFYCHEVALVVEIDGRWTHDRSYDRRRDDWMAARGAEDLPHPCRERPRGPERSGDPHPALRRAPAIDGRPTGPSRSPSAAARSAEAGRRLRAGSPLRRLRGTSPAGAGEDRARVAL